MGILDRLAWLFRRMDPRSNPRAERKREPEDPPPAAGAGDRSPLIPKTPILSGSAAKKIPPED